MPIGGRTTAVQLKSSDIFVYVSHPPTPATKAVLAKMGGEVKYLVTPDGEHDMNIEAFHKAYPQAKSASPNSSCVQAERQGHWCGAAGTAQARSAVELHL